TDARPRRHQAGHGSGRVTNWRSRLLIATVVAGAACLPRGNPPAGRQLIAGNASLGALVPSNGDGLLRVLFLRPNLQSGKGSDLFVVSLDAASQPSSERLLVSNIDPESSLGCIWKIAPCSFDASGRVLVFKIDINAAPPPGQDPPTSALWIDPVT